MMSSGSFSSWTAARNPDDAADGHEPGDPDDFRLLRQSTKTARKTHGCDACGWRIEQGQRYRECVGLDGGEFTITRHHADRGACAEGRALARAWEEADAEARQEAEAARWAEEFERRATRCDWCGSDLGRRKQGGESPELCARCFADARDLGHPAVLAQAEEAARPLKGEQSCAGGDKRPSFGGVLLSYPGDVDLERDPSPARDAGL